VGGMWEYGRFFDIVKPGLDPEIAKRIKPRLNYTGQITRRSGTRASRPSACAPARTTLSDSRTSIPSITGPATAELIDPEHLRLAAQYHIEALRTLADSRRTCSTQVSVRVCHKDGVSSTCTATRSAVYGRRDLRQDLPKAT